MPEGPEVRNVAVFLHKLITGCVLSDFTGYTGIYTSALEDLDIPQKVLEVDARGKQIIMRLEKQTLLCHLKMTGNWALEKKNHLKAKFTFLNEEKKKIRLFFSDVRGFGWIKIIDRNQEDDHFADQGPDPLRELISDKEWLNIFTKSRKKICLFLLDQDKIAGIGNYLRAEILYFSRISPHRKVSDLSEEELLTLKKETYRIMKESFEAGGLTLKDFKNVDEAMGKFKRHVYGLTTDMYGNEITDEKINGRVMYWVKALQN